MRSVGRVISFSTRARRSWCAYRTRIFSGDHANAEQLDAGMHPAHEGLSAMPFYDDFDLSTVDVLLISQYVYARLACHGGWGSAHHWSRTMSAQRALAVQRLVYHYEWNIICFLSARLR